ncbi:hypothetical protein DMA11_10945 [Marinilabiliaceae bacterium JC017]|nr:hypothetical protein DMA11_10945 [Marinilabiliaceae bacterium JC017]
MRTRFRLPYTELLSRSNQLIPVVIRDQDFLINYGIDADIAHQIRSRVNILRQLSPDEHWEGMRMRKTNAKNKARKEVEYLSSSLRLRCKLALTKDSVNYELFNFTRLATMTDRELVVFGNNTIKTALPIIDELRPTKITPEFLDEYKMTLNKLEKALNEQLEMENLRMIKMAERIDLAHELYDLISHVCEIGKLIWKNKNKIFYKDYIIYDSSKSNQSKTTIDEIETK